QRLPRCLIFDAAKHRHGPAEPALAIEFAAFADVGRRPRVKAVVDHAQRVADVAARADIAPAQAHGQVEVAEALAGHDVFAGKEAGAAHIAQAHGDGGPPMAFLLEAQFYVGRFVFSVLIGAAHAISAIGDVCVAVGAFQPGKGLYGNVVASVGRCAVDAEAEFASVGHAGARHLQQPDAAHVALGP